MIPPAYKPKKKFMQLAIAEAKRARDRGDYAIGAVITQLIGNREVVIASAGNRVKTSGSSIKHVELETLKYVSSGYGRYLSNFVLYSTHEPCAMCGCLRLVENRSRGVWRFPGRHHRLRQEAWYRGIQMARLSHFVQIRP
jgi:tRNA(Arg) A34 adenosine deaminase TadA